MASILLGIDIGGTSTVAIAMNGDGGVIGEGGAGAANPHTVALSDVTAELHAAVTATLTGIDAGDVVAGVIGMAGAAAASRPEVAAAISEVWPRLGMACPVEIVGDAVIAYAAGSAHPEGRVLIAGTGAIAARITDWQVGRTVDGLGWLLGDEGSGFWLGRAAIRHTVDAMAAGRPAGPLGAVIAQHFGTDDFEQIVAECYRMPPAEIAGFAETVCGLADAGDRTAARLAREAADLLAASLSKLDGPADSAVVLAGGLLAGPTPVRAALLERLAAGPHGPVSVAADPAVGAAWLAGLRAGCWPSAGIDEVHRRVVGATPVA
ncbi:N-acetylglucosamine kinase-like BadF-type ATPase [Stackebrandtia albiflava]|uniref:N-acetylglucosamine kinase-like BadF-type ATPase n=1 Tax=Stackebrandtia albiflava TaxID=406432 RepID=A0A562VEQ4_9ACTN|nr:BadF/BadG/BcrA/BcrD ATPase family protein [Stackebrandtia albiflava]TWJ16314.1 N-acetylglucosamine kinase-like BadF-type ATPase [Stackebrandtia albiflava]